MSLDGKSTCLACISPWIQSTPSWGRGNLSPLIVEAEGWEVQSHHLARRKASQRSAWDYVRSRKTKQEPHRGRVRGRVLERKYQWGIILLAFTDGKTQPESGCHHPLVLGPKLEHRKSVLSVPDFECDVAWVPALAFSWWQSGAWKHTPSGCVLQWQVL